MIQILHYMQTPKTKKNSLSKSTKIGKRQVTQ